MCLAWWERHWPKEACGYLDRRKHASSSNNVTNVNKQRLACSACQTCSMSDPHWCMSRAEWKGYNCSSSTSVSRESPKIEIWYFQLWTAHEEPGTPPPFWFSDTSDCGAGASWVIAYHASPLVNEHCVQWLATSLIQGVLSGRVRRTLRFEALKRGCHHCGKGLPGPTEGAGLVRMIEEMGPWTRIARQLEIVMLVEK